MTLPLRIAVVGCGKIAQTKYLPALCSHSDVEITHLVDRSVTITRAVAESLPASQAPRLSSNVAEIVQARPDAVLVLTHNHFDVSREVLQAGIDVLVEKPLCWSVTEADQLMLLAARSGARISCAYMRRFDPVFEALRMEVARFGSPRMIRMLNATGGTKSWAVPRDVKPTLEERGDIKDALANEWRLCLDRRGLPPRTATVVKLLLELGTHDLDMLIGMLGDLDLVFADVSADRTGELSAVTLLLRARDGVPCMLTYTPNFDAPWPWHHVLEATWTDRRIEASFGSPFLPVNMGTLRTYSASSGASGWQMDLQMPLPRDPFALLIDSFLADLRRPDWAGRGCADARRALSIVEQAEEFLCSAGGGAK